MVTTKSIVQTLLILIMSTTLISCMTKKKEVAVSTDPNLGEVIGTQSSQPVTIDNNSTISSSVEPSTDSVVSVSTNLTALTIRYHYNSNTGSCLNSLGESGYNIGYLGECGYLKNTTIYQNDLNGLSFAGARFDQVQFISTSIMNANLEGVLFNQTTFSNCDLRGVEFSAVDFIQVKVTKLRLSIGTFNLLSSLNWIR